MLQKKLSDFPERLSIVFPIWGLMDMGDGGVYHNFDRMMRETAERGFNCIRFEDGAGLIDFSGGRVNGKVPIAEPFPGFSSVIRQSWNFGGDGECDLAARLAASCRAARKYGIRIVLSSWYYLHTCWYCHDEDRNRYLHSLPPHERYDYFAHELNSILAMLRREGLIDTIAFAEIFNEYDGLSFCTGYGNSNHLSVEERRNFRADHEAALAWLEKENPDVLFAADSFTPWTDEELFPRNAKIWNFHNYFLWDIYGEIEGGLIYGNADLTDPTALGETAAFLRKDAPPPERALKCRAGRFIPGEMGWLRRVWLYSSLDPASFPEISRRLEKRLFENRNKYLEKIDATIAAVREFHRKHCPDAEIVVGEGNTYCGHTGLTWEERSDLFWEITEHAVKGYRDAGFRGCVIKTCCGPEDPSWHLCKDRLLGLNRMFRSQE